MKILTVKQPWAFALAAGWKDIENRSWGTLYRGPVAIHAGRDVDEDFHQVWPEQQILPPYVLGLPRGAIVAVADLVDVTTDSGSPWAQDGLFHWQFANPRELPPIPFTGALGLRHLDEETTTLIEQLLAEGARS
jgi:hypothetical protein